MKAPDWRKLKLNEEVLPEPIPDANRVVLWLPGSREGGFQHWERISNVGGAAVAVEQGICSTLATAIRARQRVGGLFSKLLPRFGGGNGDAGWVLPNGKSAQQWGDRQTDLLLVWAEDETRPLDEARVKARWPTCQRFQQIGKNLYLVSGVAAPVAPRPEAAPAPMPPLACPRQQAEQLLNAARAAGDRSREASALTDLGLVHLHEGDPRRAVGFLEEALAIARQLGDRSREGDVLGNLGVALLAAGQGRRALELFGQELAYAQEAATVFPKKLALNHLGLAYSSLRDPMRALPFLEQALALARQVGDRKHEAELLWYVAIQYAEQGRRDQALATAQETVDLLRKTGKPQAEWFAEHLRKYRVGDSGAIISGNEAGSATAFGSSIVTTLWTAGPAPQPAAGQPASGPGLLRMAFSAAKSMAKFLGSGFKTVPVATQQQRTRTCAACEHHTGLRCKLCGCFTNAKAWMAHESCPIGKW